MGKSAPWDCDSLKRFSVDLTELRYSVPVIITPQAAAIFLTLKGTLAHD
jgi:hypothetical protein